MIISWWNQSAVFPAMPCAVTQKDHKNTRDTEPRVLTIRYQSYHYDFYSLWLLHLGIMLSIFRCLALIWSNQVMSTRSIKQRSRDTHQSIKMHDRDKGNLMGRIGRLGLVIFSPGYVPCLVNLLLHNFLCVYVGRIVLNSVGFGAGTSFF